MAEGCFNPHSHAGSDADRLQHRVKHIVSIHTPTRGVTAGAVVVAAHNSFNPHSHAGSLLRLPMLVFHRHRYPMPRIFRMPDGICDILRRQKFYSVADTVESELL